MEALFWSALGVLAPFAGRTIPDRWLERLGQAVDHLTSLLPWLHGLAPPFFALFRGAVPPNYLGIGVRDALLGWIVPALLLTVLLGGVSAWLRRKPLSRPPVRLDHALLDEPRWSLYRAAGQLTLSHAGFGMLLGLLLSTLEWALRHQAWHSDRRRDPRVCLGLIRISTSALAFALSRNLWLTMAFQVGLLALLPATEEGS